MHPVYPMPTYTPGPHQFYGQPDINGAVYSDENKQFHKALLDLGAHDKTARPFVNQFLLDSYQKLDVVVDIGDFFSLDPDTQAKAVNLSTQPTNFLDALVWPALDANGNASYGVAHDPSKVTFANQGSLFANWWSLFQTNVNRGDSGAKTGTGVDAGL